MGKFLSKHFKAEPVKKTKKEIADLTAKIEKGNVNMSAGGLIPPNKRTGNIDYRKTGLVRNKRDNKRKGMK